MKVVMKTLMMMVGAALACVAMAEGPKDRPNARSAAMRGGADRALDPIVRVAISPRGAEALGLSPEQRAEIKEADTAWREATKPLREKMRKAMERQASLMKAEKIDESAVMTAIDELFDVRKEMAKVQTRRVIAVKSVLTAEQLAKAVDVAKTARRSARKPAKDAASVETPKKDAAPAEAARKDAEP